MFSIHKLPVVISLCCYLFREFRVLITLPTLATIAIIKRSTVCYSFIFYKEKSKQIFYNFSLSPHKEKFQKKSLHE